VIESNKVRIGELNNTVKLGPVTAHHGDKSPARAAILLWGPAGSGKTTFAATAPGMKLWCSFGDNEATPVSGRKDVMIADLSGLTVDETFKHAQSDNPFGLDSILSDNRHIGTVVVDSATAIAYRALQKAVGDGLGRGKLFTPTMEAPGIAAYGGRNAIVLATLTGFLRVTAKHNVNVVITAHEDDPTMKTEVQGGKAVEVIDFIGVQLGGKLVNNMTWRLSEIWNLREVKDKRVLTIRNYGLRRPMKTRMFTTKEVPQIELTYDPDIADTAKGQMTIAAWHEGWLGNGRRSLAIPKPKRSG
jgi:hypothetical protein